MSSEVTELEREADALPDGWANRRLLDICRPRQWPTISREQFAESGYPVYGANGQIGYYSRFTHNSETIAITCRGATCGTINLVPAMSYITGNAMALDDLDTGLVAQSYLYQALQHWGVANSISGSAQPQITRQSLNHVAFPFPPLDEQRRIAEVLRSVDEAIDINGEVIEQLRITRDAIRDEHFRASGMVSYARTLGSVCDITKLAGFEYSKHIQYGESDEIIAVRGLNMKDGQLSLDDIKTISRATSQALPRSALRKGDLVMSYVGTIGEVAKIDVDDRYHLAPNVALLRCGAQALPDYILHFLYSRRGRDQISKYVSTSSQQSLSMGKIRSFEINLPSLDDQRRITETMNTLNSSLTKGLQSQSQLLIQKGHLLSDLLSGHVRVPA